ncbi:MAG: hypothetical protein ABI200_05450 [Gaiellales bacterium]
MDAYSRDDLDSLAERTTNLIAHLDGALDATMLDAITGVWSTLEHAAADGPAHARAIRSRLFWQSLEPMGLTTRPTAEETVAEIVADTDPGAPFTLIDGEAWQDDLEEAGMRAELEDVSAFDDFDDFDDFDLTAAEAA